MFAKSILPNREHHIVNASGLNDFVDTNLEELLAPYKNEPVKVGIMGVWTEAKITFLAYDLKTRYPNFEINNTVIIYINQLLFTNATNYICHYNINCVTAFPL